MAVRIAGAALALTLAGISGEAYAQSVEIDRAVARVVYRVENRSDIEVTVLEEGRSALPALRISRNGNDVKIDGQLQGRNRISTCRNNGPSGSPPASPGVNATVTVRDIGQVDVENAPLILIRGPKDASIKSSGAIYGSVGREAENVSISSGGCGAWVVGNVSDTLSVSIGGSGNVWTGSAQTLQLNIGGSGTVNSTRIDNLRVNIGGSGNVRVAEVQGDMEVRIGGSGDIEVSSGQVGTMDARIAGSGSIKFDGTARDLNATIMGAGSIEVDQVTGSVSRRIVGVGAIRVHNP